jgi:hypothetical protein
VLPEVLVGLHYRSVRAHHRVPPAPRRAKSKITNSRIRPSPGRGFQGSDEAGVVGSIPQAGQERGCVWNEQGGEEGGGTHRRMTKGGQRERSASMEE